MSKNVIIADADYIDNVAFDLTVNFERMIGRPIPKADMARWVDCVALDGGIRHGENDTLVVLIHDKQTSGLKYFTPGTFLTELNGQAFNDDLGEFTFEAYPVEEMTTKTDFLLDVVQTICQQQEVTHLMIVAADTIYNNVRATLQHVDDNQKRITVFTMQPLPGGNFRQEILGYSLMAALGIQAEEIGT